LASFWLEPSSYLAMLLVAVGLGLVIFVHELGHFLVAKACGVKCEKFYLGFDFFDIKLGPIKIPRSLVKFQWGETEYGIGIIPLGGYVKMLGQDDNPANTAKEAERIRVAKESKETSGEDVAAPDQSAKPASDVDSEPSQSAASEEVPCADEKATPASYQLDPRSYPAKSVPKRMAIISAGVIMNLIFAVIFAAIAYRIGVNYTPCIVGHTVPNSPAWRAGIEPGSVVIRLDKDGRVNEHLRFDWDLFNHVAMNGDKRELSLLFRRPDGSEYEKTLTPVKSPYDSTGLAAIGLGPMVEPKLSRKEPVFAHLPAGQASPGFEPSDRIVAIGVRRAGSDEVDDVDEYPVNDYLDLKRIMARNPDNTLEFHVERQIKGQDEPDRPAAIVVAPNRTRRLGLVLEMGPIVGIEPNSPAADPTGGLREGDVIVKFDGQPVGDPMTLGDRMLLAARKGGSVELEVESAAADGGEAKTRTVTIKPRLPDTYESVRGKGVPMSCEELGIAYTVHNRVVEVEPNSPAHKAGLLAGDEIVRVVLVPASDDKAEQAKDLGIELDSIELGPDHLLWPYFYDSMQLTLPDTQVKVSFRRQGSKSVESVVLAPEVYEGDTFCNPNRGIRMTTISDIHTAKSWGEAIGLGLRQTKEDGMKVVMFLGRLVTGSIPVTSLGGPGTIVLAATSEATQGLPRLLIFLTFLSANLAVLNFLPIPVLDGGHMVFLTAEAILRRPVDEKWQLRLTLVGFAFIVGLLVLVIGLDVFRIASFVAR
jgi:regulator of sigma E protease